MLYVCVLTLKPLYHSLIVASSYLVCDFKKSISSLDSLSLLPKQPMMPATIKTKNISEYNRSLLMSGISAVTKYIIIYCVSINVESIIANSVQLDREYLQIENFLLHKMCILLYSYYWCSHNRTTRPEFRRWLMWMHNIICALERNVCEKKVF